MIGVNRDRDSSRDLTVSLLGGGINPAEEIPAGIVSEYIAESLLAYHKAGADAFIIRAFDPL